MAEISLECLKTLMHMGIALGHAANVMDDLQKEEGLPGYYSDFLIPPDKLLDTLIEEAGSVLDDCPHPPNAASDNAPPRKFTREIRELKRNWRDQPKDATITQMDNLQVILNDWVAGITGATPSARVTALTPASSTGRSL